MLEQIKKLILEQKEITGYKICETRVHSNELFFVKKNVDMDRAKDVLHYKVNVYIDFEENGKKFTGSSSTFLHPTMNEEEMKKAIAEAAFAARYVKNPYYPLAKPKTSYGKLPESKFAGKSFPYWMDEIAKAVYKNDIYDKGGINSCEIFLEKVETRVINSEGVDVSSVTYKGMVEFITTWKEEGEEIELYRCINCSDFDAELLASEVKNMITICREKAIARSTPNLKTFPVIFTRNAVKELFSYYTFMSKASAVYNQYSTWKIGDELQGENVKGDLVTITLDPLINNSTSSAPFDEDGVALAPVRIIDKGVLKQYLADSRYGYYLNVETTGSIGNMVVEGGSRTAKELQAEPHLMAAAFSDFSMDEVTGDFGGEIRLAWYFDGEKSIPVTGGSITGNIYELRQELYLSKELQKDNDFEGPEMVKIMNCTVAGV
jgi:PmbA protein